MSDRPSDEDLARLVGELVTALRDLERELDEERRRRPPLPTPGELRRFTSEVAIPGFILLLETNIRALRLLQRALELGDQTERARSGVDDLRDRATAASETTLDRLDDALAELGRAIEGSPDNEEATELLEQARDLRAEVRSRLEERADRDGTVPGGRDGGADEDTGADEDGVAIDVDAELQSIKDELDDEPDVDDDRGNANGDGTTAGESPDADDRPDDA